MSDLEVIIAGGEADPDERPEPTRRPPRRVPIRRLLVASLAVLGLAAVMTARVDRTATAADALGDIRRFVAAAETVRFIQDQDVPFGAQFEGVIRLSDGRHHTWRRGPYREEALTTPEGIYERTAFRAEDLADQTWTFRPHSTSGLASGPAGRVDVGELLSSLQVPPLASSTGRAGLAELLAAVEAPQRVDRDTIRGTLPLVDLFSDPDLSAVMLDGTGDVTVTLDADPDGTLRGLVWELKARRLTVTQQACDDGFDALGPPSCFDERVSVRFSDWNVPVPIDPPPAGKVDLTPGIDEAAVPALPDTLRIAPAWVPDDLTLMNVGTFTSADDLVVTCPSVTLDYESANSGPPPPERSARLELQAAACAAPYGQAPTGKWTAGRIDGDIMRNGDPVDGIWWWVIVHFGGTRVSVEANLSEAELANLIDSLGPLDLAAQPVFRTVLPDR